MDSVGPQTWSRRGAPRALETAVFALVGALFLAYASLSSLYTARLPEVASLTDFHLRWQEIQYVFRGVDPRDVLTGISPVEPAIGRPQFTYPPWSYILGSLFIPPIPLQYALPWFALLNAAGLVVIAVQASRLGRPFGWRARLLLPAAALATLAVPVTLRHLNYTIVVCAALALFVRFDENGQHGRAGAALAFVALKPQLGALFFLIPLFRRNWRTLIVAVSLNVAATAVATVALSKSPLTLVSGMAREGASYTDAYLGAFDLLRRVGMPRPAVLLMGMIAGVLGTVLLLRTHRWIPVRTLVGVVACITTLWSYQRTMDLLILGFLVCPLALTAYRTRSTRDWLVFVVVGGSYWFPYLARMAATPVVPELFRLVWIYGAVHLLRGEARSASHDAGAGPSSHPRMSAAPT
jgi:hypothetical protein